MPVSTSPAYPFSDGLFEQALDKQSICPVIGNVLRIWSYALRYVDPQQSRSDWLPRLDGTRDEAKESRRLFMCVDWIMRIGTPAWLALCADCKVNAAALKFALSITSLESLLPSLIILTEAKQKLKTTFAARWAAAWNICQDPVWLAAAAATRGCVWDSMHGPYEACMWQSARSFTWWQENQTLLDGIKLATDVAYSAAYEAAWDAAARARNASRHADTETIAEAARSTIRPTLAHLQSTEMTALLTKLCELN